MKPAVFLQDAPPARIIALDSGLLALRRNSRRMQAFTFVMFAKGIGNLGGVGSPQVIRPSRCSKPAGEVTNRDK